MRVPAKLSVPRPDIRSIKTNTPREPLLRGLRLLQHLATARGMSIGVRAAAKVLGVAPSSAHQLMQTLSSSGFLAHDPDTGSYGLGSEFLILAHRATESVPVRNVALTHLRRLVATCNESAYLNVYDRDRQEFFASVGIESTHVLRYVAELNVWKPTYVGAAGWAIMAYLPASEREEIVARTHLAPLTEHSLEDPAALEQALATVREQGYACTRGQRVRGTVGVSVPIFGITGRVLGGVALSLPELRYTPAREIDLIPPLIACAKAITADLQRGCPAVGKSLSADRQTPGTEPV